MMFIKVLFFLLTLPLLLPAYAITLNEALVLSLENDPASTERLKYFNAIRQKVNVEASGYYPYIDLYAGVGYEDVSHANTGLVERDETVYESALILNQNLFDGFGTTHRVAAAEARMAMAAYSYIETVNTAAYRVVASYLEVLKSRELLQVATESLEGKKAIAQEVASLYEVHQSNDVSVQKSNASLARARSDYYVFKRRYQEAQHRLKKSLGWSVDPKMLVPPKQIPKLPNNREETLEFAIRHHPAIRIADFELQMARETYQQIQGAFLPKVDAQVRQSFKSNNNGIVGDKNNFKAMVTLSYNLYRGGADRARSKEQISRLSQSIAKRNDRKRHIIERFDIAWSTVEALMQQRSHLAYYETYAQQTYERYFQEYHQTQRSVLDLITAFNDVMNAKKERVVTRYDLMLTQYRIFYIMGTLIETLLGDAEGLYAKVGIERDAMTMDTLPVSLDSDGDGYSDSEDLCQNTTVLHDIDAYGCHEKQSDIIRYSNLHVREGGTVLDDASQKRLAMLIATLQQHPKNSYAISIQTHTHATGNANKDRQLTETIAQNIKHYLVEHEVNARQIHILPKGSTAPLSIDASLSVLPQNSRVDIIVTIPQQQAASSESEWVEPLMQYATIPQPRRIPITSPTAAPDNQPTPVKVAPTQRRHSEILEGYVVILGSFHTKADAEAFALQFHDKEGMHLVLEATKRRYNLKIVSPTSAEALKWVDHVKNIVHDAWYAGKQRIDSYTVLSRQ